MELAKLRPMWRGAIIRRKEWKSIRLQQSSRESILDIDAFILEKVHKKKKIEQGMGYQSCAQDGCSKLWGWECASSLPVTDPSQSASSPER